MQEYNSLNEQTTAADIGSIEFWVNVKERFQQTQIPSLAKVIFAPYTMKTPIGKMFNLTDDDGDGDNDIKLKLTASTLEAGAVEPYVITITNEALDDYTSMYRDPAQAIANALKGFTNRRESEDALKLLKQAASDQTALTISDKLNSESQTFEIIGKVQQCVLYMNANKLRTYHSFAILPYKYAGALMAAFSYQTGANTIESSDLQIAKFGTMTYYVNPDPKDDYVYVGLRHPTNKALCAGIYGDYQSQITTAIDKLGNLKAHIHRRYAMAMSPLHTEENPMLCKFKISGL